jgi:methionyl-tRNA synthetase
VHGAEAEGVPTQVFVDQARRRSKLRDRSRSRSTFHSNGATLAAPGVERLWRAAADVATSIVAGTGPAVGANASTPPSELVDGCCPEHGTYTETVGEENWFFRLSRYQHQLVGLIERGELEIVPETYRNEVLALLAGGLDDISVSRSQGRARGWGIPVPDDPTQVVYVWWDALGNYITALDYGTDGDAFDTWWRHAVDAFT